MRALIRIAAATAVLANSTLAFEALAQPALAYKMQSLEDNSLQFIGGASPAQALRVTLILRGSSEKADADRLVKCLANQNVIEFSRLRTGAEGVADAGEVAAEIKRRDLSVKYTVPDPSVLYVYFEAEAPVRSRGTLKLDVGRAPDACQGISVSGPDGPLSLYVFTGSGIEEKTRPALKTRFQAGAGTRGASIEFEGSRELIGLSGNDAEEFTLDASGKIPLGRPRDVRDTPGASKDASRDVADVLNLSLNHIQYSRGGKLDRKGLRVRATGSLRGAEVTGYWSPVFGWFDSSHGFYGAEVEAGWRKGDAEFTTLVTRKPDIGHTVARVGAVAEWAPRMCLDEGKCINSNLSQGLRFFVRGRLWVDSYKEQGAGTRWRARPFIDSELFYNFTKDDRVFLRAESGYLPPDLSTRSKRIYVGVGKAF